ncbi:EamA family transporter RarD [Pseudogemmobacter humi]|uniref:Putative DMT superfamily transporter inner membrane protein n=1 Tax=Pseudogemmobacter humi TaxID=2483812 RepID=A0A3P5XH79_9RHOB|nr:EamA family transporter RarD [Pseudogemmobacter humi]VDC30862.1 putative DMT superfamily transporter inner membrane protein [Pseudogemmobacter humi]
MEPPAPPPTPQDNSSAGLLYALSAYLLWGFLPLFMKALDQVSPVEVVAHRVIWAVPAALAALIWMGRTRDLQAALRNPRMLGMATVTALLVSLNWCLYVWAITTGHALDAALGYYINPLFSILLGAVLLGERLRGIQWLAILCVVIAVAILTWKAGSLPLVAMGLVVTWGFYAYFKKSLPVGPNQGFALEVLILLVPAVAVLAWLGFQGRMEFLHGPGLQSWLLFLAGPVTALPLMLYANGAKRLRLTTIALMQYISPTMIFLLAVFVFHEPFSPATLVAFGFIWVALAIYSVSMMRRGPATV